MLATRSRDGMSLVTGDENPLHIPANMREVFDVSGAGDTVIATFASAMAAKIPMRNAALLANIAAGIVVGKPGTATARPEEIETAMSFDFQRVLASKRAYRQKLAPRPVAEKLRLLDELRARALAIRRSSSITRGNGLVAEPPAPYRTDSK